MPKNSSPRYRVEKAAQHSVPDKSTLRRYADEGLTQQQMADRWEAESGVRVSRSAIGMALARYEVGGKRRRRARYEDMIPWNVKMEHQKAYDAWMLRLEARFRRGEAINPPQMARLDNWKRALNDHKAVVVYYPDTEEGFFWTPRSEDDDDIVRPPS